MDKVSREDTDSGRVAPGLVSHSTRGVKETGGVEMDDSRHGDVDEVSPFDP